VEELGRAEKTSFRV
jgi:hypothetical protein